MSSIAVIARCRPENQREKNLGSSVIFQKHSDQKMQLGQAHFGFDNIIGVDGQQEDLYRAAGEQVLESTLEGFAGCLFAYGQTGSGKSHSIMGTSSDPGVVPRLCSNLFRNLQAKGVTYEVSISFLEIYNEQIKDLLVPNGQGDNLQIRQHPSTGVFVAGLKENRVYVLTDIEKLLESGNQVRTTAATVMNATSSRSHAVIVLNITQIKVVPGKKEVIRSVLNVIDLAGSERQKKTQATGDRLKEGSKINNSLSHLGKVIAQLAENVEKKTNKHVPFRNSKLTYLLSNALSGNCKTMLLAAISPVSDNEEESLRTLRFAETCKKIMTRPTANVETDENLVAALKAQIAQLQTDLLIAREESVQMASPAVANPPLPLANDPLSLAISMGTPPGQEAQSLPLKESTSFVPQEVKLSYPVYMPMLIVNNKVYYVHKSTPTTIGSDESNDIVISSNVPRFVCQIANRENQLSMKVNSGAQQVQYLLDVEKPEAVSSVMYFPLTSPLVKLNGHDVYVDQILEEAEDSVDGSVSDSVLVYDGDELMIGDLLLRVANPIASHNPNRPEDPTIFHKIGTMYNTFTRLMTASNGAGGSMRGRRTAGPGSLFNLFGLA